MNKVSEALATRDSHKAAIELVNLSKSYRDADRSLAVIDNVSFSFPASGSVAIIGRSGIGKSTLMHLLGVLDVPTSGAVLYGGRDVSSLDSDARAAFRATHIGFIFQFHHLLPEFSAIENVAMPLVIMGQPAESAWGEAASLLARMGLSQREKHLPSQLSGGEQQRVAIARALVTRPGVILADEPTGNLDVVTAGTVQEMLLEMSREQQSTLIIVTHSRELASSMGTVVEMLPGGSLVPVSC